MQENKFDFFKTVRNTLFADFNDHFVHRVVARVEKNVCQRSSLRDRCKNSSSQIFPINILSRRLTPNTRSDSASLFSTIETRGKSKYTARESETREKRKKS